MILTNFAIDASNICLEYTPLFVNPSLCAVVSTRSTNTPTGRVYFPHLLHNNFRTGIECMFSCLYDPITSLTRLPHKTVALSYYVLRIQQPPSIRLVDIHAHKSDSFQSVTPNPDSRGTTPTNPKFPLSIEHDTLHALSLSSKPIITHSNPIFGMPSLQGSSNPPQTPASREKNINDDDMDWTPTQPETVSPFGQATAAALENDNLLRPQRFFAPENPTGLEGLFESTRIQEDEPMPFLGTSRVDNRKTSRLWKRGWLYMSLLAIVVASIAYTLKWSGLTRWAI